MWGLLANHILSMGHRLSAGINKCLPVFRPLDAVEAKVFGACNFSCLHSRSLTIWQHILEVLSSNLDWTIHSTVWSQESMSVSVSPAVKIRAAIISSHSADKFTGIYEVFGCTVVNRGRKAWWNEQGCVISLQCRKQGGRISWTVRISTAFPKYHQSLVYSFHKAGRVSWACSHQRGLAEGCTDTGKCSFSWLIVGVSVRCDNIHPLYCWV